jgi:hypothetical protein
MKIPRIWPRSFKLPACYCPSQFGGHNAVLQVTTAQFQNGSEGDVTEINKWGEGGRSVVQPVPSYQMGDINNHHYPATGTYYGGGYCRRLERQLRAKEVMATNVIHANEGLPGRR